MNEGKNTPCPCLNKFKSNSSWISVFVFPGRFSQRSSFPPPKRRQRRRRPHVPPPRPPTSALDLGPGRRHRRRQQQRARSAGLGQPEAGHAKQYHRRPALARTRRRAFNICRALGLFGRHSGEGPEKEGRRPRPFGPPRGRQGERRKLRRDDAFSHEKAESNLKSENRGLRKSKRWHPHEESNPWKERLIWITRHQRER